MVSHTKNKYLWRFFVIQHLNFFLTLATHACVRKIFFFSNILKIFLIFFVLPIIAVVVKWSQTHVVTSLLLLLIFLPLLLILICLFCHKFSRAIQSLCFQKFWFHFEEFFMAFCRDGSHFLSIHLFFFFLFLFLSLIRKIFKN